MSIFDSLIFPDTLPPRFDNLFKGIVRSEWCNQSDGDVEAPTGYFSTIEVPVRGTGEYEEFAEALADLIDAELLEEVESGWYFTIENNLGLIWVYHVGPSKHRANLFFKAYAQEYDEWAEEEDA